MLYVFRICKPTVVERLGLFVSEVTSLEKFTRHRWMTLGNWCSGIQTSVQFKQIQRKINMLKYTFIKD
uniref:Uncharacterized protein n=1 Tax=Anguilla anguilla TaxID=7936 RepID=A0A0E9WP90_ANGAN